MRDRRSWRIVARSVKYFSEEASVNEIPLQSFHRIGKFD
jgi:hypothetical protein